MCIAYRVVSVGTQASGGRIPDLLDQQEVHAARES